MPNLDHLSATCEAAIRAGARELMAWKGRFSTREKAARDLVTDADLASQEAIRKAIRQEFPDHGFLGEEDPNMEQLDRPYCWIVDPLDGTTNYVHHYPFFAVSVAVAQAGQLVAGGVLDPIQDEYFEASLGQGSKLNGQPIAVSNTVALEESLLAVSLPPSPQLDDLDVRAFLQVVPRCQAVRRTGSAALNLAYVACGRLDAHWAHFIHPWDSAAGILLVREAGGVATAAAGGEFRLAEADYLVGATRQLHETLLPLISGTNG